MDAGSEEGFIRVDVSDPREHRLIKEGRFNGAARFDEPFGKLARANRERLRSHSVSAVGACPKPPDSPKAARIAKSQLRAAAQVDEQVSVWALRRGRVFDHRQLAAHPQVNVKLLFVVQHEDDALAAPIDRSNQPPP